MKGSLLSCKFALNRLNSLNPLNFDTKIVGVLEELPINILGVGVYQRGNGEWRGTKPKMLIHYKVI